MSTIQPVNTLLQEDASIKRDARRKKILSQISAPKAPEFDAEKAKDYQNLSKAAFIAEGINALTQGMLRAKTDHKDRRYITTPARFTDLGLTAVDELQKLDLSHRKRLDEFQKQVFDTSRKRNDREIELWKNENKVSADLRKQYLDAAEQLVRAGDLETGKLYMQMAGLITPETPDGTRVQDVQTSTPSRDLPKTLNHSFTPPFSSVQERKTDSTATEKAGETAANPAPTETLLTVQQAIEHELANNPDPETRDILLTRWKNATRDYLAAHDEVSAGQVDWWTDKLFEDLKTDLNAARLEKKRTRPTESEPVQNRWDTGLIGLFNRMAKIVNQPVIGYDNLQQLDELMDAEPGEAPSWKELYEQQKENFPEMLKEYLVQPPTGSVSDMTREQAAAELETIEAAQNSIKNVLFRNSQGPTDRTTRDILHGRFVRNEKRKNELLGVVASQNDQLKTANNLPSSAPFADDSEKRKVEDRLSQRSEKIRMNDFTDEDIRNWEQDFERVSFNQGIPAEDINRFKEEALQELLPENTQAEENAIRLTQRAMLKSIIENPDSATREILAQRWLDSNRKLLTLQGVPDEQIDSRSEQMFGEMLKKISRDLDPPEADRNKPRKRSNRRRGEIQDMRNSAQI